MPVIKTCIIWYIQMISLLRIKLFINFNDDPSPQYINEFIKN